MDDHAELSTGDSETQNGGAGFDRTALGFALLFSVPVGVGVSVMMMRVTGRGPLAPIVFGPGLVVIVAIFLFMFVATRGGYEVT